MIDDVARALTEALGGPVRLTLRSGRGHSGARTYRGVLPSGETLFVKLALTDFTRQQLAHEALVYQHLAVEPMVRYVTYLPDLAVLALEDVEGAYWPPPWQPGHVEEVAAALDELHRHVLPAGVPVVDVGESLCGRWSLVAADPSPFLSLGLCDEDTLRRLLPTLIKIDEANDLRGSSVCHLDLRSDNMCRVASGWKFLDWSYATAAAPALDFVLWLPSLIAEVGHVPSALAEYAEHPFMVSFAGYLAAQAGLPEPPGTAGNVREIQRRQLRAAFPLARAIAEG